MNDNNTTDYDWDLSRRRVLHATGVAVAAGAILSGTAFANEDEDAADDDCDGTDATADEDRHPPSADEFTLDIDNRYFPLPVGRALTLEGEEDGTPVELVVTVLDETETVGDVTTRVVEERESEDGELIEISRNYFAQSSAGDVWYFGEAVDIYEEGEVVSSEGAWRADESDNEPGLFMPADPQVGMQFQQEQAPGVAEDEAIIIARGETVEVPAGTFENSLRTYDTNPLEPGVPGDIKVYAPDLGIIVDGPVELVDYVE